MTTESLKDELHGLNAEIRGIQAQAEAERRDLTAAEEQEINSLFAQFKDADVELQRLECRPTGRKAEPQIPRPQNAGRHTNLLDTNMGRKRITEIAASQRQPYAGRRMADLFGKTRTHHTDGFNTFGEYLQAVTNGINHPGLVRAATMVEGTGADGGFTVPSQYLTEMFDQSLESELIRPRARVYPMASSELNIASVDYSDHSSNIGGLDGHWIAENTTETAQKAAYRQLTLRTKKLAIYTEATSEVVADGLNFERSMRDAMAQSLEFSLDEAFIRGTGAGQPIGILNASSTISVAKDTSTSPVQPADTIRFKNLVDMWSRLHPALANDAIWIINPECLPQLMTLSYPGSTDTPLFIPNQNAGEKTPGTIFGRPLYYSEKCSALGDQGDIILVAPSMYAIGMRLDASFDRSIAPGFMRDVESFRLITRVDGQPLMNAAVTPRYGSNTLSWAVVLDDRT